MEENREITLQFLNFCSSSYLFNDFHDHSTLAQLTFSQFSSVQFNHSLVSDSLQPHGVQHARPPYSSPTLGVYSNSHPSSRWCHPTISSSVIPFSSCLQSFSPSGSLPVSQLFSLWPKYWSFSISPSSEYSGLISFSIYWFDLLAVCLWWVPICAGHSARG